MIGFSEAPRFAELVHDLFGGDEDVTPPGILLESDRPEYGYSKRERLWTSGPVFVGANVGNVSLVDVTYTQLVPFNTQRMLAVITGIKVCGVNVVAGDRYQLTKNGAAGAVPAANFVRDDRWDAGSSARTMLQNRILNTVVGVSGDILDEVSASVTGQDLFFSVCPLLLHQAVVGQATASRYTVFTVAQNKALRCVFWGYERLARPEEFDQ